MIEQFRCFAFDAHRHVLDCVRAANGIDRVRDAALVQDDLLCAQRDRCALFGREGERLILAVAMKRLRAAEHRGERLQRDTDNIVVGLLRRQRASRGLRMKAELLRARIGRAEPVGHASRPEPPRRAEFRNLLEKIVVRVEEERDPLTERVDVKACVDR